MAPLTKALILKSLRDHRQEIQRFGVHKIGLFGSFVKGKQRKESDVDLLVSFTTPTFDNYMDLKFFLEDMFHRKVDLVMDDALRKELDYVRKEAVYA